MQNNKVLTKELCNKWYNNKNINPLTSRKITETGAIYKSLKSKCSKILNDNKNKLLEITKDICDKWIKNKNINPITLRKIGENGAIYKKFNSKCITDSKNDKEIKKTSEKKDDRKEDRKERAANKIKKILTPFINRVSANIKDRVNFYIIIKRYINSIKKENKKKNICIRLYNFDEKTKKPIYRLGNKIILDKQIGSESAYGIVFLAHYKYNINQENKYNKLNKFAIKVINYSIDNMIEYEVLKELTLQVLLSKCPNFPISYGLLTCNNKYIKSKYDTPINIKITESEINDEDNYPDLINNNITTYYQINELASGDFMNYRVKYCDDYIFLSNAITQIYISLMFFHKYINAHHNDAHGGNFLFHKIKPGGYFHYNIYGKDYYLENIGYLWVIWDFGLIKPFNDSKKINNNKFGKYTRKIIITSDYMRPIKSIIKYNYHYNRDFGNLILKIKDNVIDKYSKSYDISLLQIIDNNILNILSKNNLTLTTIKPLNIINKKPYII